MLHFRMDMPFYLMAVYGSVMILVILLVRALLKERMPGFVFPVLWGLALVRLLVPFSLSSPLSPRIQMRNPFYEYTYDTGEVTVYRGVANQAETVAEDKAISADKAEDIGVVQEEETLTQAVIGIGAADYCYSPLGSFSAPDWRWLVPAVYVLGLLVTAAVLGYQKYRYSRKLRNCLLVEHNETINGILREMDMGDVLVFTNDEIASPLVCGLISPRILLPTRMDFENTELLRHILTHETVHIRRKDNWVKAVMLIALCLNWWNPLVWIMSKCLSSDLERACDAAVLKGYDGEGRKAYAMSLLAMAITGSRPTLLYSAFSKLEVEKRIKSILHYKKVSAFGLLFAVLFLTCGTVAFATAGTAPFDNGLSSYCASSNCRWGVRAFLTRDIATGANARERAGYVILGILSADQSNNPKILEAQIKPALAEEFGVEEGAFRLEISLCLDGEERDREYETFGLVWDGEGNLFYKGEQVRRCVDLKMHFLHLDMDGGTVDLSVLRDECGFITSIAEYRQGDREYELPPAGLVETEP